MKVMDLTFQTFHFSKVMDRTAVIDSKSRGRMVLATGNIPAGTVVVLEDPVACVPFTTSSIVALSCTSGKYKFTNEEDRLQQSTQILASSSFSGNMCMLAARFYLFGNRWRWTSGCVEPTVRERYETVRNHMTASQSAQLMGMHECAVLVQRLVTQTVHSQVSTTSTSTKFVDEIVSIAECTEILCKLCCNLFTITDDFQNEAGIGCYPRAALLNHSCEPNCAQSFDAQANIVIRAVADIPKGAELCISYTDTGYPTWYRQRELLRAYHFHCTCSRCSRADWNDQYVHTGRRGAGAAIQSNADTSTASIEYAAWLSGGAAVVTSDTVDREPVLPVLPFPLFDTPCAISHAKFTSPPNTRSDTSNGDPIRHSVCEVTNSCAAFTTFTSSTQYKQHTSPEKLYVHIAHYQHLLSLLQKIVSSSNYCMHHVRKRLKIAFEERLPVRSGVLLFPPLKVRAAVKNSVAQMNKNNGSNNGDVSVASSMLRTGDAVVVVYSPLELRAIYEDNLRRILHTMPHCYSPTVPNLCYTFYRIQYVWYMLSKADSLVAEWSKNGVFKGSSSTAHDMGSDVPELRRLAAQSAQLLKDVEVVYGPDHMFYADMQHCAMQLQRA